MADSGIDCLIIGAGAAGLTAARQLTDDGLRVVVLEARERIGGRLFTDRSLAELPIDLGGELIHGGDVVTWEIIRAAGISTAPAKRTLVRHGAQWVPFDPDDRGDIDVDALPEPLPGETRSHWLARAGVSSDEWPDLLRFLNADGEPFDRVGARGGFSQWNPALESDPYGSSDFMIHGGYDEVLQPLADGIKMQFGQVVTRIRWLTSGVEVQTTDTSGVVQVWQAPTAIVTLPIGVLKAGIVDFSPPLPVARQEAIDRLSITSVVKLIYGFDQPIFPSDTDILFDFDNPIPIWWTWRGSETPVETILEVVTAWAAGDVSRRLRAEVASGDQLLALGLAALKQLVGQEDLEPTFAAWHDWEADPFARGAYSSVPPGAEDAYATLAVGDMAPLLWAGEATIPGAAKTVHGAISSGRRAAQEVIALRRRN